jgi:hypothetical protein
MTQIEASWGGSPSARYEELAERFRPTFRRIREGAVAREAARRLPVEEIGWLKELGACKFIGFVTPLLRLLRRSQGGTRDRDWTFHRPRLRLARFDFYRASCKIPGAERFKNDLYISHDVPFVECT